MVLDVFGCFSAEGEGVVVSRGLSNKERIKNKQTNNKKMLSSSSLPLLLLILSLSLLTTTTAKMETHTNTKISKIAFGSCSKHDHEQPLWDLMLDGEGEEGGERGGERGGKPDVFAWLGDVVYADKKRGGLFFFPGEPERQKTFLDLQRELPGYKQFRNLVKILGVWDDHDYGINDGDKTYAWRNQSKKQFLNFLDEPQDSPRWGRGGVYGAYSYGPEDQRVSIILLDVRFFKTAPEDILGEEQWEWLEKTLEIAVKTSKVVLIGSGTQILPASKPLSEKYGISQRRRLLGMIQKHIGHVFAEKTVGGDSVGEGVELPIVMLLSGDVHYSEILHMDCPLTVGGEGEGEGPLYPIYEVTSSGMTHALAYHFSFDFLKYAVLSFINTTTRVPGYSFGDLNYGMLEIAWDAKPLEVKVGVWGVEGKAFDYVVKGEVRGRGGEGGLCVGEETVMPWIAWLNVQMIRNTVVVVGVLGVLVWVWWGGKGREGENKKKKN